MTMDQEIHEGVAQMHDVQTADGLLREADWVIEVVPGNPGTYIKLGGIAEAARWKGRKIRVTVEEIE